MKTFLLRIVLFALPIVGVGVVYIAEDPFKVVRSYSNYRPKGLALSVPLNQGMVSTAVFERNHDNERYNAFIFGSSRSMFYRASDWKRYIPEARVYHFDASSETIEGILHKVQYVANSGCEMKHALIVIDGNTFESGQLFNEHLFIEDPRLIHYQNLISFQSAHWMAFLDRNFLRAYADYRISGQAKPYMSAKGLLDNRPFVYDSLSNELRYEHFEELIASGEYYTSERMKPFYPRDGKLRYAAPVIGAAAEANLQLLQGILAQYQTDFYVIISPLYNQIRMAERDVALLKRVFGEGRVYDFSGVNRFTADYTHYYERSHYRPFVAAMVLDSIYAKEVLRSKSVW